MNQKQCVNSVSPLRLPIHVHAQQSPGSEPPSPARRRSELERSENEPPTKSLVAPPPPWTSDIAQSPIRPLPSSSSSIRFFETSNTYPVSVPVSAFSFFFSRFNLFSLHGLISCPVPLHVLGLVRNGDGILGNFFQECRLRWRLAKIRGEKILTWAFADWKMPR